jgi:catechol 2,3-dioxygenase-like lactoylglutathione lyase family enzyme
MIDALDHVVLAVHDLDDAVAVYQALLDRPCDARGEAGGAAFAWFRLSNMALALATRSGAGPTGELVAAQLDGAGEGLAAMVFAVADLARARDLTQRRGLVQAPALSLPAGRFAATAAADPALSFDPQATHGVRIALVERRHDAPLPADAASLIGLDHVVVRSPHPDRALALYGARLGLDLRLDRSNPAWDSRLLFFRCGDLVVEIAHGLKAGVSDAPDQLWGLSWRVPDIAAAHARLAAAGVAISELRTGRRPGTRVFTVRDRGTRVPTLVLGLSADSR